MNRGAVGVGLDVGSAESDTANCKMVTVDSRVCATAPADSATRTRLSESGQLAVGSATTATCAVRNLLLRPRNSPSRLSPPARRVAEGSKVVTDSGLGSGAWDLRFPAPRGLGGLAPRRCHAGRKLLAVSCGLLVVN
jgi:hypothetical protein